MWRFGHSPSYYFFRYKNVKSSVFNLGYRCLIQSEGLLNYSRRCYWFKAMNNTLVVLACTEDRMKCIYKVKHRFNLYTVMSSFCTRGINWSIFLRTLFPKLLKKNERRCKVYNYLLSRLIGVQLWLKTLN